jgi:3-hydroxybutyryl-CoA dehydrogenase
MDIDQISHIGIIGTGMIGTSMAVLTTGHGYKTTIFARSPQRAKSCRAKFDAFYKEIADRGLMNQAQVDACASHLEVAFTYDAMADADVVFECVAEAVDTKHSVYGQIELHCHRIKAICSVSSAMVVDELAKNAIRYKDRIIVAHPFNPPHLVPFFELAMGSDTADGVIEFAANLLEAMDRKPVVLKKSAPGFIGNRLQFALWREALHIVASGIAEPEDIDTCLKYSFCPRYTSIGIFEHFDSGGLQLNYNVSKMLFPELCNDEKVIRPITEKIEAGDLGPETGKGFYNWENVDMNAYNARVSAPYWKYFNWKLPKT